MVPADALVDPAHLVVRRMSRTKKEEDVSGIAEIRTETQETEDERIVQLVSSGASSQEDGDVLVLACSEEPRAANTGMRLTEDDAWALSDALRQAAQLVAGSEPQRFIRLQLLDDDAP